MKVISCDGHLVEPLEALPVGSEYLAGERMLVLPEGYSRQALPVWTSVGNGHVGIADALDGGPLGIEDCPAAHDPKMRAWWCEKQGVEAEVLYPTFAALAVETADSQPTAMDAAALYNYWALETFQPPMFYPLALIDVCDSPQLTDRFRHYANNYRWLPGFLLPQEPPADLRWRDFIPAFRTAADLGLPIHWHAFTRPTPASFGKDPLALAWEGVRAAQDILLELILGGVFKAVPGLKVVFAEMDVGWVWHFEARLKRLVSQYGKALAMDLHPVEIYDILQNNVFFVAQQVQEIRLSSHKALWGWDFPHSDAVSVPSQCDMLMTELNLRAEELYPRLGKVIRREG